MIEALRFTGNHSAWLVVTVAMTLATLVAALYLRETRSLATPWSFGLPALRGTVVALLVMTLAGPVWHSRRLTGVLGHVTFAVDTSQSMAVSDSSGDSDRNHRLQRSLRLLTGGPSAIGWLERLKSTHEVDVIAFSADGTTPIWSSNSGDSGEPTFDLRPDGLATDLASPLGVALQRSVRGAGDESTQTSPFPDPAVERRTRVQSRAIVLMTDGQDNWRGPLTARQQPQLGDAEDTGQSVAEIAGRLAASSVTVHAVGFGSEQERTDVSVGNIESPESVVADGTLAGNLTLQHFGVSGEQVTVKIADGNESVWTQTVTLGASGQQIVPFDFEVDPLVQRRRQMASRWVRRSSVVLDLKASVESVRVDDVPENDMATFRVAATMRDRRLLILDGSSRWEIRYLKNLFDRDPAWDVDTVIFGPGTDMPRVVRGNEPGQFPRTREAFGRYDAIVLGEVPDQQLTPQDLRAIEDFVRRGGGLIIVDGRYGRIASMARQSSVNDDEKEGQSLDSEASQSGTSGLADLIPVRYLSSIGTGPDASMRVKDLTVTDLGAEQPSIRLSGRGEDVRLMWKALPAPASAIRTQPTADAQVWIEAVNADAESIPWMVTKLYGSGRVFYLSSDQTWRWRYKVADRFHARFWNQLLQAAMQPPYSASDEFAALGTDKIEYAEGEVAVIRSRLQDPR
ncbi:MAG: VWA domain-containing protein, partial [Planctomycetota bacterium]